MSNDTNYLLVTAQCSRCHDSAVRTVDANDGGEFAVMPTLDDCDRCGHDKVLTCTVVDVQS